MNAKNIILAILMVLSFAACSSEIEGIDNNMTSNNNVSSNGTTSISVRMMTSNMNTKGAGQETLTSSVDQNITSFVIAVFEQATGARIGYATSTNQISGGAVTSATIEGIDTKEGTVNVIAVANVTVDDFKNFYDYNEFANHIVRNNLNDFVKVGTTSTTLKKGQANQINIELVQLTACVNVQLITNVKGVDPAKNTVTVTFKATGYTNKVATSSTILNPVANAANSEVTDQTQSVDATSFSYNTYALNAPKLRVSTNLRVVVDGNEELNNNEEISVPFVSGSDVLKCLESGKIYTQVITVNITLNISQDVISTFTYEVAPIREINNEITFG